MGLLLAIGFDRLLLIVSVEERRRGEDLYLTPNR